MQSTLASPQLDASNKTGLYRVGQAVYHSKIQALIEATRTGQYPTWEFNDHVFGAVDWTKPLLTDLTEVYQRRARALREQYDHVCVTYSAGSDSYTVLHAFLSSGAIPDEVQVFWPIEATQGRYKVSTDRDVRNTISEWDLNIRPDLEWLARHYPQIKITVIDYSRNMQQDVSQQQFFAINTLTPGGYFRFGIQSELEARQLDRGRKAATVWGYDKPQFAWRDGCLWFYFIDKLPNQRYRSGSASDTCEFFFWTPDDVDLIRVQTWRVYEYLAMSQQRDQLLDCIDWSRSVSERIAGKKQFDRLIRDLLYPQWIQDRFQAHKPSQSVPSERDLWMFGIQEYAHSLASWQWGLNSIRGQIHNRFHQYRPDGEFDGWVGFISPFYKLGPIHKINQDR